jgi:hypothetical protein
MNGAYWVPQVIGGTGFIVSSTMFMLEVQEKWCVLVYFVLLSSLSRPSLHLSMRPTVMTCWRYSLLAVLYLLFSTCCSLLAVLYLMFSP